MKHIMITMDDHIHTNFSDGKNSPEEMILCAVNLGLKRITFTDHVREDSDWIEEYVYEIEALSHKYKSFIEVKIGVESKIKDFFGGLDCPEFILKNDIIQKVAAIHRIPCENGVYIRRDEIKNNMQYAFECYIKALKGVKNNCYINRIAHPFSLCNEFQLKQDSFEWLRINDVLTELNLPFEYNLKYDNSIVPDFIWKKNKDKIVLGSDSHSVNDLEKRINFYKKTEDIQ